MSITGTLFVPHNCYLSTTFILQNKPIFTMDPQAKMGLFRKILAVIVNITKFQVILRGGEAKPKLHSIFGLGGFQSPPQKNRKPKTKL